MKRISVVSGMTAAIFLLLALILAGCGGNGTSGDGGENAVSALAEKSAQNQNQQIDACKLVTQQDASKIMGKEAKNEKSDTLVVDPAMLGECEWSYDYEMGSELIQFRVWGSEMYYGPTPDSESFDVGDKGTIRVNRTAGVDIEWVQDGKTFTLSYFTTGPDAPDATAQKEAVKALAKEVSGRL